MIKELRSLFGVTILLENSQYFNKESEQLCLFDPALWDNVSIKLSDSIIKFTPKTEKEYKQKALQYEKAKEQIIDGFIAKHVYTANDTKCDEKSLLLQNMGYEYVRIFQNLITPPGGKERITIQQQIKDKLDEVIVKPISGLFYDKIVAQHV